VIKSGEDKAMKPYVEMIRRLRTEHGLTQKEVAGILGTTQQVYSRYENGENELPIRHLIALCGLYHVSADEILQLTMGFPGSVSR